MAIAVLQRGEGCVTAQTLATGRADAVLYKARGKWTMGGVGEWEITTFTRPVRDFNGDDVEILKACPIGWPCTYWFDPESGTFKLSVHMEEYAEDPC